MQALQEVTRPGRVAALFGVAAVLSACATNIDNQSTSPVVSLPSAPPDVGEAARATYRGIYEYDVTLSGGRYEGEPFVAGGAARPTVTLVRDIFVTADLDGDGREETAVLLAENSGGSGERLFVAVLARHGAEVVNAGTALLGDRVQVREFSATGATLELEVIQAGPGDAMCCPTEMATRRYVFGPTGLVEKGSETHAAFTVAALAGSAWRLERFDFAETAPAEPPITLVFEAGRIAGGSGCNRYFATVENGDLPGTVTVGPPGMTMMACPGDEMALEERYMKALSAVDKIGFLAGRLALSYSDGESRRILLFVRE